MGDLTWGGREFYIADCPDCPAQLAVPGLGDRILCRGDGSHTVIYDPVRTSDGSGS